MTVAVVVVHDGMRNDRLTPADVSARDKTWPVQTVTTAEASSDSLTAKTAAAVEVFVVVESLCNSPVFLSHAVFADEKGSFTLARAKDIVVVVIAGSFAFGFCRNISRDDNVQLLLGLS